MSDYQRRDADDPVRRHFEAVERLRLGSMREEDGTIKGTTLVEVRCPKAHLLGTVRTTDYGLLWQTHGPDPLNFELEATDRQRFGRYKAQRRMADLLELLADRDDPSGALRLFCRCGDRGSVSRAELVRAARRGVHGAVRLTR